ncbi:TonB-dependent receptor [Sphingopyxis sp. BSNA05]|uniref:TonB-dependent receptor n=1 Tax=Sphingopyxis sp. BSNA05 TaxID=1236614 RepID=UPI001565695A|nr:TonB-dependent receptor [Sphingopyxis sp. BSNA05]NRD88407.1 TonB-dependent receptor [Sphingopyxis sp. BSNA05]
MARISKFRKELLIGSAAVLLALPGVATAGTVSGVVSDSSETRGLQAAQVRIVELDRVVTTGRDGSYRFPDVPAGTYTLETRYIGADTSQTSITISDASPTVANILLQSGAGTEILVIGQSANQASSLSRKREADGVSSVLTRDAIGQFPDQNVAESLRRVPGVNILNDQGEGRFVSVRGLDPNLNASSLNGVRIPSPESDVRSVALDVISSDLIESIEIKKSLTPDMDGDTIGASIEIKTVSAFDRKKDLLTGKIEGSYNDYAGHVSPKGSIDFSTRLTDNIGVAGGLSYYKRKFETDNIEAEGWDVNDDGVVYAEEVQYRDYDVERERISASLSFDFRASDSTELYVRGIYSQFDDQEFRGRTTFKLDEEASSGDANSALFDDADGEIEIERDIKDRMESQKIRSVVLGGKTETGPWKVEYSGSWSKSSENEDGSLDPTTFSNKFEDDGLSVLFDYADGRIPTYSYASGSALANDPGLYELDDVELTALSAAEDEEFSAKLDVSRQFAMGNGDFTVQAGFKGRWREKRYDNDVEFYEDSTGTYTLADVLGTQTYRITDLGPVASHSGPTEYFRANFGDFELQEIDSQFDSAVSDYVNQEDIYAGYLLGRWDSDKLRVIGGVRFERTENVISANTVTLVEEDATFGGVTFTEDTVVVAPNSFSRSYDDWLPSLNIRFEPQRNLVLRAAGYRSVVRPNLSDLAPRFAVEQNDDDEREGEFGNPDLLPYEAWNFDASAEFYFSSNGALTANLFYKDIKNFIVESLEENGTRFGIDFDEATIPINGSSAEVFGIELGFAQALNFLPDPLDGFLVNFNYTYTDATGTVPTDGDITDLRSITLPSSSKHTFNAVLGYEKGPFDFRLAGTYRDRYLDELGAEASEDRYVDNHFQLDASVKFKLNKNIRLFAEWININNAKYFAYQNFDTRKRLLQYEEYGSTFKFGAKITM